MTLLRLCLSAFLFAATMAAPAARAQTPPTPYSFAGILKGNARVDTGTVVLPSELLPAVNKWAYVGTDGQITVSSYTSQARTKFPNPLPVTPTGFVGSPEGTHLILTANVPGSGGQIVKLDLADGQAVLRIQLPDNAPFAAVRISRVTGNIAVLTGSPKPRLLMFDGTSGTQIFDVQLKTGRFVTFRPDGQQVIITGSDRSGRTGIIQFLNATTGAIERILTKPQIGSFVAAGPAAVHPGGSMLAVQMLLVPGAFLASPGQDGATAVLLNAQNGAQLGMLKDNASSILSMEFSADGSQILTAGLDRIVRLWSARTGTLITRLNGHSKLTRTIRPVDGVFASFVPPGLDSSWIYGSGAIISRTGDGEFVFWENSAHQQERLAGLFTRNLALAEKGDRRAMNELATAYRLGRGTARDPRKAEEWLGRLAAMGDASAQTVLARMLIQASGASQDCGVAGQLIRKAQPPVRPSDTAAATRWDALERQRNQALQAIGGVKGAAEMAPSIQADLLETQMLQALTKQDGKAFLANLCALEFLGHADSMPAQARNELHYHRAVALRAQGKPLPALAALNLYLTRAGRAGANYQAAIQMLRPLQEQASK